MARDVWRLAGIQAEGREDCANDRWEGRRVVEGGREGCLKAGRRERGRCGKRRPTGVIAVVFLIGIERVARLADLPKLWQALRLIMDQRFQVWADESRVQVRVKCEIAFAKQPEMKAQAEKATEKETEREAVMEKDWKAEDRKGRMEQKLFDGEVEQKTKLRLPALP